MRSPLHRFSSATRAFLAATALCCLAVSMSGCGGAPAHSSSDPAPPDAQLPPAQRLAGQAALAQDKTFSADYRYTPNGGQQTTAHVERTSAGIRLDIAVAANQTTMASTVSIVRIANGTYRCIAVAAAQGCQSVDNKQIPEDPRFEHVFDDWLSILSSSSAALSVTTVKKKTGALAGVKGTCFSVEGVTASLKPPVDPGTYCFDDGTVTAAQFSGAVMILATTGLAPASISLPAPPAASVPSTVAPSPSASLQSPSVTPTPSSH